MVEKETNSALEAFGSLLREERVRCGYTVDEVASRLKITARVVRAIEDGDMDSMPHAVYASGFIRAYARMLGISEEEVRPVCALLRDADEEQPQDTLIVPPHASRRSGGNSWSALLLILVVVLSVGWYFREELPLDFITNMLENTDRQATPAEPRLPPEAVEQKTAQPLSATPSATPAVAETTPEASALPVEPVAPPDKSVVQNDEAAPVRSTGFTSPPSTNTVPSAEKNTSLTLQSGSDIPTNIAANTSGRKHQIILTALAECWVHSTADGTDTRQLSIQKGETFALSFDRKLVVKLGNAGGVRIKYDGNELPPAGNSGQVKTLTFPPQDAQN